MSQRVTRSRSRAVVDEHASPEKQQDVVIQVSSEPSTDAYQIPLNITSNFTQPVTALPSSLRREHTKLDHQSHTLLLVKQRKLRALNLPATHNRQERFFSHSSVSRRKIASQVRIGEPAIISNAISSTLIFASESAGTAVCIHGSGLILTCAHCIAESKEEFEQDHKNGSKKLFWLLTAGGNAVEARCVAWDERRDMALLKVVEAQGFDQLEGGSTEALFRSLQIASSIPAEKTSVICIGHPGSEDLEAAEEGVKTGYPVLAVSEGRFLGYAKEQDIEDNSDIGALMHDAWTYWGHSGAPIVDQRGRLVGLHSSWDDKNGMRRGVGVQAVHGFLEGIDHALLGRQRTTGGLFVNQ
ncbi:hypothetical protein H2198_001744 [Neophaeococcomyces mojaviensis]|uniref:Uncharacterized protein n=1 Tax=Neophaeococcomyces mojaviensis TaxID=3383035 RepID=A0ACC3AG52_9EURO|nr:hypothetical protein H2198_001744 [Knufia sp. JES_112]